MSTMDSLINTGAMTIGMDLAPKNIDEKTRLKISRISTLVISIIAVKIRSILKLSFTASDVITSGVFVPLIMGFFWKRGNSYGALASMLFGIIFAFYNLVISLGVSLPAFWKIQHASQAITGIAISFIIYVFVSLITRAEYEKIDNLKSWYKGE